MELNRNEENPVRMVRFCMQGHEIVYTAGEMLRSVCPFCKSPMDRRRLPMKLEDWEDLKKKREKQQPEQEDRKDSMVQQPEQKDRENSMGQQPEQKDPENLMAQQPPSGSPLPMLKPQERRLGGVVPGSVSGDRELSAFSGGGYPSKSLQAPRQTAGFSFVSPENRRRTDGNAGFYLNYFGEKIPVPAEGGWVGREGIGREWFDGNLMISRKHVFIKPDAQTGRLRINEDKSLNGVFYTDADGNRVRVESARLLNPGDILWLYNIPLTVEKG